jgi:hypothetical protein
MLSAAHKIIPPAVFSVIITVSCVFSAALFGASAPGWLAFGDLRGSLEPCGCDPKTDLGGIKRILTAIDRERIIQPNVGVFCLGNILGPMDDNEIKNEYLLRGNSLINPDATLFNTVEFSSLDWLGHKYGLDVKLIKGQNFVLSNLSLNKPWISEVARIRDYVVFGYTFDPKLKPYVQPFSDALLKRWQSILLADDAFRKKILLFSGSVADLDRFKASQFFDDIISSHVDPVGTVPSTKDKENESRLIRGEQNQLAGRRVLMVPLAGQGYLRGGDLRNRSGASLERVFLSSEDRDHLKTEKSKPNIGNIFDSPRNVTWLLPDTGENKKSQIFYEEYMEKTKNAFDKEASNRVKDLASSPFAGIEICGTCHPSEVEKYKSTRHFRAMETLLEKGKDRDPDCVICHSVGSKTRGGFVSLKHSPHLAGVQCENCHGPRKSHSENPMASRKVQSDSFQICTECHNSQHSPKFQLKEYWLKIEHGRLKSFRIQEKSGPGRQ